MSGYHAVIGICAWRVSVELQILSLQFTAMLHNARIQALRANMAISFSTHQNCEDHIRYYASSSGLDRAIRDVAQQDGIVAQNEARALAAELDGIEVSSNAVVRLLCTLP